VENLTGHVSRSTHESNDLLKKKCFKTTSSSANVSHNCRVCLRQLADKYILCLKEGPQSEEYRYSNPYLCFYTHIYTNMFSSPLSRHYTQYQ
jgi:hypothetical protein